MANDFDVVVLGGGNNGYWRLLNARSSIMPNRILLSAPHVFMMDPNAAHATDMHGGSGKRPIERIRSAAFGRIRITDRAFPFLPPACAALRVGCKARLFNMK
jgi:hypothetical protein